MKNKEHFEVILEDINSKLSLLLEKLGHKIDKYNIDLNKQIDEMNKFLKKVKRKDDDLNKLVLVQTGKD